MARAYPHNDQRNRRKNRSLNAPFDIKVPSSLRDPTNAVFSDEELIRLKTDDQARDFALGYLHNHEQFAALWNSTKISPNTRRLMRKVVQIQTINAVCNG
jgi:hypothetical protein